MTPRRLSFGEGGHYPVKLVAGLDDVVFESEPVDDDDAEALIGEGLGPLAERCVGGERDRAAFLAFGEDLEQQLRADFVQVEVAELVQAEQVVAPVCVDGLGQALLVCGFDDLDVDRG